MKVFYYWIAVLVCSVVGNSQTLTPEAKSMFTDVKSKLSIADKNAIALKSGLKLQKNKTWKYEGDEISEPSIGGWVLNSDGVEEVCITMGGTMYFGMAGEGFSLYMKDKGQYKALFEMQSGIFGFEDTKTKGFADIVIGGPGFEFPKYVWDGSKYKFLKMVKEVPLIEGDIVESVPDEAISTNAADLFKGVKSKLTNAQKNKITQLYGYTANSNATKKNKKVMPLPVDLNSDGVEEIFIHIKTTILGIDSNEYVYYVPDAVNGFKLGLSSTPMTLKIVISENKQPFPFILSGKKGLDRDVWQYNPNTKIYEFYMRAKAADANLIKIKSIEEASLEYTNKL